MEKHNYIFTLYSFSGIEDGGCIYIKSWFRGKKYKHMTFVTKDHIVFHVNGTQEDIRKIPSMLDYSMSTEGVTCNLKSRRAMKNLKDVQTVLDSYFNDIIFGNDAPNFLTTHGNDYLQGNGGKDIYKITGNCRNTTINNIDQGNERDIIFIEQNFSDISTVLQMSTESLELVIDGSEKVLTILHWFTNESYRHAAIRTADGVTAVFPQSIAEMRSMNNRLKATEISLDQENCSNGLRTYNLNEERFHGVMRFTAKSDLCSYRVIGNGLNNYIDPGPGNPHGYQYLEGGSGSDTYVIGSNYGRFNEINNYAEDDKIDFVLLTVGYKHIQVNINDTDLILRSTYQHNHLSVYLRGFLLGKEYQHMLLQSSDKVLFRLLPHYPHKKPVVINYSQSKHSQIVNLTKLFSKAGIFYGSKNKTNVIYGSDSSTKLSGGFRKDNITGGSLGETIEGLSGNDAISGKTGNDVIYGGEGNDVINGNEGNDVIYGGNGADSISGDDGMDTVIFKGDSISAAGVTVSLRGGFGKGADAQGDTYASIEAVIGSEFNDNIEGNDFNNILSGNSGNDTIVSYSGYDVLVGGQGWDLYNLTRASGRKIINNYASDGKIDQLILGRTTRYPCYFSFKNDLFVHFEMDYQENIDIMFKQWYNGSVFQHLFLRYTSRDNRSRHTQLKHKMNKTDKVSSDRWVKLFRDKARIKVVAYSNDYIVINIEYTLNRIPTNLYNIFLNYVSENKQYRKIDISRRMTLLGTNVTLTGIAAGVITSVSLSLHRCSQVLAMTLPVTQRTTPNPPIIVLVTQVSEVSITVQWELPSNISDPDREYYSFRCMAKEIEEIDSRNQLTINTTTPENTTNCLIDRLKPNTGYHIKVYSIAGGEESNQAAVITQRTLSICRRLREPQNGMIVDAERRSSHAMARLDCSFGYELTVVDMNNTKISKVRYHFFHRLSCIFL